MTTRVSESTKLGYCSFHEAGALYDEPVFEVRLRTGEYDVAICAACAAEALERLRRTPPPEVHGPVREGTLVLREAQPDVPEWGVRVREVCRLPDKRILVEEVGERSQWALGGIVTVDADSIDWERA